MAAIIERDDAAPCPFQRRHPARQDPVYLLVGGKAVHQHDRLAFALIEEGYLHTVVAKTRHGPTIRRNRPCRKVCAECLVPFPADRIRLPATIKFTGG